MLPPKLLDIAVFHVVIITSLTFLLYITLIDFLSTTILSPRDFNYSFKLNLSSFTLVYAQTYTYLPILFMFSFRCVSSSLYGSISKR